MGHKSGNLAVHAKFFSEYILSIYSFLASIVVAQGAFS